MVSNDIAPITRIFLLQKHITFDILSVYYLLVSNRYDLQSIHFTNLGNYQLNQIILKFKKKIYRYLGTSYRMYQVTEYKPEKTQKLNIF